MLQGCLPAKQVVELLVQLFAFVFKLFAYGFLGGGFCHVIAVADLRALSQCDYIMGPPSTFSLVGAMYRDVPIRFMTAPEEPFTLDDFSDFAHLFRYEY